MIHNSTGHHLHGNVCKRDFSEAQLRLQLCIHMNIGKCSPRSGKMLWLCQLTPTSHGFYCG